MLNEDQRKHIANSIRIVAMAQFAVFGYPVIHEIVKTGVIPERWPWIIISGVAYLMSEIGAVKVLERKDG